VAKRELAELKTEARQLSTVVAAKAALENKMQELEWRLSAENKMKKKAEKENAKLREELEELRKAMREVKLADERREKEEEERRARKEKEGREQVRNHGKELEELRAKLAEEAERSAALARELAALKEASERDRERATASQQESEEAKNLREENEHMKDLIRQMEEKMEVDEEDYEAKIHELHRELEKLRYVSVLFARVWMHRSHAHTRTHAQDPAEPVDQGRWAKDGDAAEADQRLHVDQDFLSRGRTHAVGLLRRWQQRLATPSRRVTAQPLAREPALRGPAPIGLERRRRSPWHAYKPQASRQNQQ
jgi:hypothetical protein